PLFISVAESIVTFGPIDQFGWRSACSGVAARISSIVQVRNGPPEAVRMMRWTFSRVPAASDWKLALGSESTGTTAPPRAAAGGGGRGGQVAGADQGLVVGKRDGGAALGRGQRRPQPGSAGDRAHDPIGRPLSRLDHRLLACPGRDPRARERRLELVVERGI